MYKALDSIAFLDVSYFSKQIVLQKNIVPVSPNMDMRHQYVS